MSCTATNASQFGALVRQCRRARGWSARRLADRVGCSLPTVRRVEAGAVVSWRTVTEIAQALDLVIQVQEAQQ